MKIMKVVVYILWGLIVFVGLCGAICSSIHWVNFGDFVSYFQAVLYSGLVVFFLVLFWIVRKEKLLS